MTIQVLVTRVSVKAYNPDQPRHPAGDPRGGQWAPRVGGKVEYIGSDTNAAALDVINSAGIAPEAFLELLRLDGHDCEYFFTRGYFEENASLFMHAEYRDPATNVRMGKITAEFSVEQYWDEEGQEAYHDVMLADLNLYTYTEDDAIFSLRNKIEQMAEELGWTGPEIDPRPDLAPGLVDQGVYSEKERDLLAFRVGYKPGTDHNERRVHAKTAGQAALVSDGINDVFARQIQDAWHTTANDNGGWQDELHLIAHDRSQHQDQLQFTKGMNKVDIYDTERRGAASKAFESISRRTQSFFAEHGLGPDDEIVLYRGTVKDASEWGNAQKGEKVKIKPRPLTSWSLSLKVADEFARSSYNKVGLVYGVRVPVKYAFAHASTGFGCLSEEEIVLLGDALVDRDLEIIEVNRW